MFFYLSFGTSIFICHLTSSFLYFFQLIFQFIQFDVEFLAISHRISFDNRYMKSETIIIQLSSQTRTFLHNTTFDCDASISNQWLIRYFIRVQRWINKINLQVNVPDFVLNSLEQQRFLSMYFHQKCARFLVRNILSLMIKREESNSESILTWNMNQCLFFVCFLCKKNIFVFIFNEDLLEIISTD